MDINTLNTQLTYLEETKQQIKQAIINKGQDIQDNDTFRSYVDKINNLTDTRDGTATANEIVVDKVAYVDGNRLVGTMGKIQNDHVITAEDIASGKNVVNIGNYTGDILIEEIFNNTQSNGYITNGTFTRQIPSSIVQTQLNLTSDKIKAGETILGVNGKSSVVDTDDANAVAQDLSRDAYAYVNGQKIRGSLSVYDNVEFYWDGVQSIYLSDDKIGIKNPKPNGLIIRNGAFPTTRIDYSVMANAIGLDASKLVAGNTILGVTGDAANVNTSDANATADNIENGKTAYVNGQKIVGNITVNSSYGQSDAIVTVDDYFNLSVKTFAKQILLTNSSIKLSATKYNVINQIGLTADILKKDETILGVTGTYEGLMTAEDYATCNALLDEILGQTA